MKKFICIILIVLFALTACVRFPYVPPYGKWESADGILVLDMNPETAIEDIYSGIYYKNGTEIPVLIYFPYKGRFMIFDAKQSVGEMLSDGNRESVYFYGEYNLNFGKNKLKYKLLPYYQERIGYPKKRIIFNKIEDYEIPKENAVKY